NCVPRRARMRTPSTGHPSWSLGQTEVFLAGSRMARLIVAFGFVTTGSVTSAQTPPFSVVARVLDYSGDWTVDTGTVKRPVWLGEALPAGARLAPPLPYTSESFITIVLDSNRALTRSCAAPHACDAPFEIPGDKDGGPVRAVGVLSRFWRAVASVVPTNEARYVSAIVRSGRGSYLDDAVVPLRIEEIDLRAVFGHMDGGSYLVALAS